MQDKMWECRDGRRLLVSQMEYTHILFCIRKIQRSKVGWRKEYLPRLELELDIRRLQERER